MSPGSAAYIEVTGLSRDRSITPSMPGGVRSGRELVVGGWLPPLQTASTSTSDTTQGGTAATPIFMSGRHRPHARRDLHQFRLRQPFHCYAVAEAIRGAAQHHVREKERFEVAVRRG